ncbi:MAG: CRTAC1 family protein [Phycisphaerae bacterium]|jgi:hypothetical protein
MFSSSTERGLRRPRSVAAALAAAVLGVGVSTSLAEVPYFLEQAAARGLSTTYTPADRTSARPMFGGGACGDFNGDGWLDLFVCGGGGTATTTDKLYMNNGDGTFTDRAAEWGVAAVQYSIGAACGDYDGDGWLDLYVTSLGVGNSDVAPGMHRLYRNNGGVSFTNVAAAAGVNYTSPVLADGMGAAFGDYDLDGDLDLAVAGWFENTLGNRLFRNNGDGTFTDVTASAIPTNLSGVQGFSPRFVDMDRDRWPELLWVADFHDTIYLENNRDGTFKDSTAAAGVGIEGNGMGQTVGDFDNDGRLDWYVTSIFYDFPPPGVVPGNMLYRNLGNNVYVERSLPAGVRDGGWGWGTAAVDLDHDGWLDLVETNGWNTIEWKYEQNYLYMNQGGSTFIESAVDAGLDDLIDGRGLLNFDFDNDGDQDIVIFCWREPLRFYVNQLSGPQTNWLRVALDTSGRSDLAPNGIGSRITVRAGGLTQVRHLDSGTNYLAQSELFAHFGLAGAGVADELRVRWNDGTTTSLLNVAANQTITVRAPVLVSGGGFGPLTGQ